ncbi:MAG: ABC transporter permease [Acidaminococcales bacterium]|jgi:ABC-2 type transport system permease protein|nr:ABC transporter permease [Acidaminococcales bacterium]
MIGRIREILRFREMVKSFVRKELRTRYKGSFLGFLWTFINPLAQLAVYTIVSPYILRVREDNYAMFLFVALLPWGYFTGTLTGGCGVILAHSSLVDKVYFPREILPLAFSLSGLLNLCFGFTIVLPTLAFFGVPLTGNILWLPALLLIHAVLCSGISFIVSAVNVYFRDLEQIIGIAAMALYFMTPVMYPASLLPETIRAVLSFNPMFGLVLAYRDILFYGNPPDWQTLVYPAAASACVFVFGFCLFGRLQRNFTEIM